MPHQFTRLIITGGSSGIGAAILERFMAENPTADAINLSRSEPKSLKTYGDRIRHFEVDLSRREEVNKASAQIHTFSEKHPPTGAILLVNNSGIGQHVSFQKSDRDPQLKAIDLNISGTVNLSISLLPLLLKQGGQIATISSTSAFQPTPYMSTYGATKTFLLHWSLALNEDLRGTKVSTFVFCPGATETPFIPQAGFNKPIRSFWAVQSVSEVTQQFFTALDRNKLMLASGFTNRLIAHLSRTAPIRLSTQVAGWLMKRAKDK